MKAQNFNIANTIEFCSPLKLDKGLHLFGLYIKETHRRRPTISANKPRKLETTAFRNDHE